MHDIRILYSIALSQLSFAGLMPHESFIDKAQLDFLKKNHFVD